jgi:hypothetical protein
MWRVYCVTRKLFHQLKPSDSTLFDTNADLNWRSKTEIQEDSKKVLVSFLSLFKKT